MQFLTLKMDPLASFVASNAFAESIFLKFWWKLWTHIEHERNELLLLWKKFKKEINEMTYVDLEKHFYFPLWRTFSITIIKSEEWGPIWLGKLLTVECLNLFTLQTISSCILHFDQSKEEMVWVTLLMERERCIVGVCRLSKLLTIERLTLPPPPHIHT